MLTGILTIDNFHHEVMQLAAKIMHCHDQEVPEIFRSMLATLEQTFDQEQRLMEEFQFPVLQCHMEQHARVLASLHHLHPDVMAGDYASARRAAGELLPEWFQLHMATQDAALGVWVAFCQQSGQAALPDQHDAAASRPDKQHPKHFEQTQPMPNSIRSMGPLI